MSIQSSFASSKEARLAGWISRRHQSVTTRDKSVAASEAYWKLERQNAEQNTRMGVKRGPKEQLAYLDERFGKDVGAKKERARLLKKLS